ncbi:hypothetical protein GCM10027040_09340 [Halomonas shantousis]
MRIFAGIVLTLIVLIIGTVIFSYSGVYDIAASRPHAALTRWAFHTTMHNSVEARAEGVAVPDLSDDTMVRQGARAYDAMCVSCHLRPGLETTLLYAGLNPQPPELAGQAHWGPAEQFWIVKHGIRMTGMPAWGATHNDEALWPIVAFLQRLPELSEQQYAALTQADGGSANGPADDGHDHEHDDMSGMMGASGHANGEAAHGGRGHAEAEPAEHGGDDHFADGHTH